MPRSALVVLADGFEEVEALAPIDLLRRVGVDVTVAGVGKKDICSSRNITVVCDSVIEELKLRSWDAIILPGGMPGAVNLFNSESVKSHILSTNEHKGLICAICASPAVVLAPLGILNGKKATCYPGMEVNDQNITFTGNRIETDGQVITAKAAGCAIEFGLKIVEGLQGSSVAEKLADSIGFDKY